MAVDLNPSTKSFRQVFSSTLVLRWLECLLAFLFSRHSFRIVLLVPCILSILSCMN